MDKAKLRLLHALA